ncbi:hypothetical protein CBR_g52274 [Chara braunii]|uniref:BED-type domain-containing protein n=1 Tax=Chara braunii TaxID=69332 RepID=A0A388M9Y4_CHABU|nr:hypothetical protein CBR_g52274 [Chara braunii]|eukprot:GBG91387.1 hypothetical protein CBR_g52274 [Chara braunii]
MDVRVNEEGYDPTLMGGMGDDEEQELRMLLENQSLPPPPEEDEDDDRGDRRNGFIFIASAHRVEREAGRNHDRVWVKGGFNNLPPINVKGWRFLADLSKKELEDCRKKALVGTLDYAGTTPHYGGKLAFPTMSVIDPTKCVHPNPTGGDGGSGGNNFVPGSDVQMAEQRKKSRVWRHVTQGQRLGTWEKRHWDYKLRCNYCKHVWQGNLFKAQRHFTQLKRCSAATMDVFVDLWNHTDYEFEKRHHRGIVAYMREHNVVDRRAVDVQRGSGRGRTGALQSQAKELDPVDEVERFLDEEARRAEAAEGRKTARA